MAHLDSGKLLRARAVVKERVDSGAICGAAFGVAHEANVVLEDALGFRQREPEAWALDRSHRFDLASLTKVVATTPLVMGLLEAGMLRLDDLVDTLLSPGADPALTNIRIRHLLTHTSGLPGWLDLTRSPAAADRVTVIRRAARLFTPGERVLYSDLNYLLLGYIVERLYGLTLKDAFRRYVADPLGMSETDFGPVSKEAAVATERDPANGQMLLGVVHDENARYGTGFSGHAGLFGTARDLLRFGQAFLDQGRAADGKTWRSPATIDTWLAARTRAEDGEIRALGFQKPHRLSSAGDLMSSDAVGHTGFTGTSLWIDPRCQLVMVLLTNRVHPTRENQAHIRLRPLFHNAIIGALEA